MNHKKKQKSEFLFILSKPRVIVPLALRKRNTKQKIAKIFIVKGIKRFMREILQILFSCNYNLKQKIKGILYLYDQIILVIISN